MKAGKKYFCAEPWTGILSTEVNLDVVFCPCYLKMRIGNLRDRSLAELWNSDALIALRKSFAKGELPAVCQPQLCPVAVGKENYRMG
jgi:hypothetical protein